MKRIFCLPILAILFFSVEAFCGSGSDSLSINFPSGLVAKKPSSSNGSGGFNIKTSPAFFWKTVSLEFEVPLGKQFSIGVNLYGKLGRTDNGKKLNYKVKNEDFLSNGLRGELVLKYYLKPTAPEGLFVHANFAYNQIVYSDGTTKPYSLNVHQPSDTSATLMKPFPFSAGVGVGYQIIIIPKHIIGNVMMGVQGNMDAKNNPFISLFIAPSIGYVF